MRNIIFTADDRRALAHYRFHHPEPRVQRKIEVLWLKSHGLGHDRIAAYADVSRRTVQRYLDEYLEGGLQRLCRGRGSSTPGRPGRARGLPGGALRDPPGPLHQAGPRRHRAEDRHPPGPDPGPPLPQGPARAPLAADRGHPRAPQEDDRRSTPGSRRPSCGTSWGRDWSRPARAAGRCTSWTRRTSCSRRSWAACGAWPGCSCGRPRAASVTTCWGRWTR